MVCFNSELPAENARLDAEANCSDKACPRIIKSEIVKSGSSKSKSTISSACGINPVLRATTAHIDNRRRTNTSYICVPRMAASMAPYFVFMNSSWSSHKLSAEIASFGGGCATTPLMCRLYPPRIVEKNVRNTRATARASSPRLRSNSRSSPTRNNVVGPAGMASKSSSKYVNDPSSKLSTKISSHGRVRIAGNNDECKPTRNGMGAVR
mmetsp:Transcript_3481/g.12538  ORF Transcript_3481/g.12538 Transcript_3481/m.12538 type:complete len:209 (-) Transcript_3481:823-1449(-)